jgi:hypothetical protein
MIQMALRVHPLKAGSFGARPCRRIRQRLFLHGPNALPTSWQKKWLIQRIIATPPWADFSIIRKIYAEAAQLSFETGIPHVVDHIIPLNHPLVCGLHNQFNLQAITKEANDKKSNRCPEIDHYQMELFK